MEWTRAKRIGVEWKGMEWSREKRGVAWSGKEWSGV